MTKQQSYRQIFKATSLFGGVQFISVLTGIVRSKFVAIFLGPVGMGISALLVSTVTLVIIIASMGLNFSAVRDISKARESGDTKKLSFILIVFKRWLWISCFVGVILLISFSHYLSIFTFGNNSYTVSFVLLSLMLIFTILTNGNTALLQGLRKIEYTAKSAIIGSLLALITTIPIYYFLRSSGIVPALIIGSIITFLISVFFANKIVLTPVLVSRKDTLTQGGEMAKLGVVMVMAQLIGLVAIYVINTFIRSKGGLADVGLYQAGTSITNQSIGLVFTAMAMDYYPRLAAVSTNDKKLNDMVNQQGIITVLIAAPMLISLIVFAPLVIKILLTSEFYAISFFIRWLALGTLFTAPIVVLSYISLAKGDKKAYFLYSSLFNSVLSIAFYIAGYLAYGLMGMAIAFSLFQLIYLLFLSYKFNKIYAFSFNIQFVKIFLTLIAFCMSALIVSFMFDEVTVYILGGVILVFSVYYSWYKLDSYIGLKSYVREKFLKSKY
ncbi:oligosaccharide flippase family protein [Arcticibacter eurypsychrophilus]|uniref:oligosaccharide flippase family protein n=1 Tax=Arcticibacter eurypsychrophilus TaxID=1434752 RepID=UPI00084D13E2|nr:oligosaccharide flippase family protein [Arcticibacter eurypsychrophilus]